MENIPICAVQTGKGYGFIHERNQVLSQNKIRASPDSLPNADVHDYSNDVAIVDEASRILRGTKTITADEKDFSTKIMELEPFPDLFKALKPLRAKLMPILSGKKKLSRRGLNHSEINKLLGQPPAEIAEMIATVVKLSPSWSNLEVKPNRVMGRDKQWNNSIVMANCHFQAEAAAKTQENLDNLASNFLIPLLSVWAGLIAGSIRIDCCYQLHITTKDTRHGEILCSMQQVILLDTTANKKLLAKRLGIEANSIIEIEQESPKLDNLTVINLQMEGMRSSQWSPNCLLRCQALVKHLKAQYPDIPILSLKKYANALSSEGWWFNDNRGSNAFKGREAIAAFGKPQINLGAAQDEYRTLYGNLEGFNEFYQSLVDAEIIQFFGRQRAHLYPEREFFIYLIGTDFKLDYLLEFRINMVSLNAFDLCPEAGTRKQISQYKIIRAIEQISARGNKAKLADVAAAAGLSPHYTKELVGTFGGIKALKKRVLFLYESNRDNPPFFRMEFIFLDSEVRRWLELEQIASAKKWKAPPHKSN